MGNTPDRTAVPLKLTPVWGGCTLGLLDLNVHVNCLESLLDGGADAVLWQSRDSASPTHSQVMLMLLCCGPLAAGLWAQDLGSSVVFMVLSQSLASLALPGKPK